MLRANQYPVNANGRRWLTVTVAASMLLVGACKPPWEQNNQPEQPQSEISQFDQKVKGRCPDGEKVKFSSAYLTVDDEPKIEGHHFYAAAASKDGAKLHFEIETGAPSKNDRIVEGGPFLVQGSVEVVEGHGCVVSATTLQHQ